MCMGKNVTLKKTNMVQKFQRPSRSLGSRPVTFGYQ
jgi:hypothetical protein